MTSMSSTSGSASRTCAWRALPMAVVMANTDYRSEQLVASIRLMIGRRVTGLAAIVSEMAPELIDELNSRTMRRIGSSRRALFEAIERPALQLLPAEPFEYAEWKRCRAGLDYHIEVHGHWYSVPYRLIREVVEARITDRTVEVFHTSLLGNRSAWR